MIKERGGVKYGGRKYLRELRGYSKILENSQGRGLQKLEFYLKYVCQYYGMTAMEEGEMKIFQAFNSGL